MPWVRLDDAFHLRPRVRSAGLEGRALFIAGLCYASQNLTDGHLPAAAIPLVAAMAEVQPSVADLLVDIGLWRSVAGGYDVVDYLTFNPSREKVIADREAAAERQRKSRGASRRDSHRDSAVSSDPPVPVPTSDLSTRRPGNSRANGTQPDDDELSTVPDETWTHYADLKCAAQTDVRNPAPWKATAAANARTELGDQAARWWHDYELTPYRLAQALIAGQPPAHCNRRKATA